jgi:hypothetical protein
MARKVDEASNFAFVQLNEKDPSIYDKSHPDYARRDKGDLVWEKINVYYNENFIRTQIQNMSAKTMQTATTVYMARAL